MSSKWPIVRLGDLVDIKHGWPFKSEFFSTDEDNSKLPIVVAIGNFKYSGGFRFDSTQIKRYFSEFPQDYVLRSGEILLVMTCQTSGGEILGIPGRVPNDGRTYLHNQRLGKVVPKSSSVLNGFLYWLFLHPDFNQHLVNSASGTKILHTAPGRIESFQFKLPSLEEQKHAADVLDSLDDRITLLRETNATLEAIAQALFKSWFVDFGPVRAKMEGRAPEGMDEATAALFPDGFEESELGTVPRGWRVGSVADLGDVVCGKTPPTSDAENYGDDVPFITIPDMHGILAVTSTARSLSHRGADSQAKKYLPVGSICVSCIATPGLVVLVTEPSQTNQQINSVVPDQKWGGAFPLFLLRRIGDKVRSGGSGGSVFHNLSKSSFEKIRELLPSEEVAIAFGQIIDPLVVKIIDNQRQAETVTTLRDTLLPRLISGQLKINEAAA